MWKHDALSDAIARAVSLPEWTALYDHQGDAELHVRKLEQRVEQNSGDASLRQLLHYLRSDSF